MNAIVEAERAAIVPPDRRKFIGGSDVAAILGISPWRSIVDLWIDKTTPPVETGTTRLPSSVKGAA